VCLLRWWSDSRRQRARIRWEMPPSTTMTGRIFTPITSPTSPSRTFPRSPRCSARIRWTPASLHRSHHRPRRRGRFRDPHAAAQESGGHRRHRECVGRRAIGVRGEAVLVARGHEQDWSQRSAVDADRRRQRLHRAARRHRTRRRSAGLRSGREVDLTSTSTVRIDSGWDGDGIGWHEITAVGSGASLANSPVPAQSVSDTLLRNPNDLLFAGPTRGDLACGSGCRRLQLCGGTKDPGRRCGRARAEQTVERLQSGWSAAGMSLSASACSRSCSRCCSARVTRSCPGTARPSWRPTWSGDADGCATLSPSVRR